MGHAGTDEERSRRVAAEAGVGVGWRLALGALRRLPQGMLSRCAGRAADLPIPRFLRRPVLGTAARVLGMNLAEAELPLVEYGSLNRLFVRRLRPGTRPVEGDASTVVSPVDGLVGAKGTVSDGLALQLKGRSYSVAELLADDALAARYEGGLFVTIYLTPRHYHRIHSPCDGAVNGACHVPGGLMPVNPASLALTPQLFARNERLLSFIDSPLGLVSVVAVGAFNVGRISAAFDSDWNRPTGGVTNRPRGTTSRRAYEPPRPIGRGDEIMAFHLGSTVVLLFEAGRVELRADLRLGDELRVGQALAVQR